MFWSLSIGCILAAACLILKHTSLLRAAPLIVSYSRCPRLGLLSVQVYKMLYEIIEVEIKYYKH